MALTTAQLWERVHLAGLATPEQCRQWARAVADAIGQENQIDPALVIKELVQQEKLSAYQANVLYRELSHPLQLGKLRVTRSLEAERGTAWYEGEDAATARWSAFPPKALWIVAIADETLANESMQAWPPSLRWAERHCHVHAPHLDRWMQSGATLKHLYAVCEAVPGLSLREVLEQGPLSISQAHRLVLDVAAGLKFLHTSKLVHGHLCLDAVVWNEMHGFRLLRDPLFPPRSPYHAPTQSVLGGLDHRLALAAPELFAPNALPSVASDLYALGCLWYRCLTGQWPVDPGKDAPVENWAKLHAHVPVTPPERMPATQVRCLMHLLAKDPAVRFANVDPLLRALDQLILPAESTTKNIDPSNNAPLEKTASSPSTKSADPQTAAPIVPKPDEANTASEKPVKVEPTKPPQAAPVKATPTPVKATPTPVKQSPTKQTPDKQTSDKATPGKPIQDASRPTPSSPVKQPSAQPSPASSPSASLPPALPNKATNTPTTNTPVANKPTVNSPSGSTPQSSKPTTINKVASTPSASTPAASTPAASSPAASSPSTSTPSASTPSASTPSVTTPTTNTQSPSTTNSGKPVASKPTAAAAPKTKSKAADGSKPTKAVGKGMPTGKKKSKPKRPVWFMPMVVGCSILLLSLLLVVLQGNKKGIVTIQKGPKPNEVANNATPVVKTEGANKEGASAIDPMLEFFSIQSDASNVPWTPPSVGAPYSTEMLPPGLEAVLFLKQEIVAGQASASNSVSALSSWWSSVYPSSKTSGTGGLPEFGFVATDAFNTVAVGWYPGASVGTYHNVLRWSRKDPGPLSSMLNDFESWKSNTLDVGSKKYRYWTKDSEGRSYAAVTDDFSSKAEDQVKRLTIGPLELLKPMFESEGKSGPLRRQLDSLLQSTDSRADVTFLAAPSFLFGDGKEWLGEHSGKVRDAMREIVDDRVQALLCRVHFEPEFYLEYRTFGNDLQSASRDAVDLRKKLAEAADTVESQLTAQPAATYWRPIANRFPQMLRALHKYSRAGAEDGQVVFNAYLPKESAMNLAIGSWMALQVGSDVALSGAGKSKTGSDKPTTTTTAPKTAPKSIDDLLATKVKLRIEQESLEVVLQAIATELKESQSADTEPIPMAINGTAFQKDGITRNQQIRNFDYSDTPVRDLLTALVRRANPVTTVQNPNEKDQKVVWLLLDDPSSPTKKKLELTTRAWAEGNNAALPKEFELPNP